MRRALVATAAVAAAAFAVTAGVVLSGRANEVEEPPYTVLGRWGDCELRQYPALTVAQTRMGEARTGENRAFRTLAGYIFGANARAEKIAMTAPVVETPGEGGWTMRFTMPQAKTLENLPAPKDSQVETKQLAPARIAVLRFSGWARDADLSAKARELDACLRAHGLKAAGPASLAQYDPPWVLGPWRRNEAMIPVA